MTNALGRIFLILASLVLAAPLANAESQMEKSQKQVCMERCDRDEFNLCKIGASGFGGGFGTPASKETREARLKNCEKERHACRGKCGSYEGTRVIRR